MERTVALDEVKAEAIKADGAQELEPLYDVLPHKLLRVVDVGRRYIVLPGFVVARAAKDRIIVTDGFCAPRQPASIFIPPPFFVLPHIAAQLHLSKCLGEMVPVKDTPCSLHTQ